LARRAQRDDYTARIEAFFDRHQISNYRFERRRKHRAVVVTHLGKECTIIFPASGSDWRGPANAIASLRHALGLVGKAPQ
jgi:hypothetical protein